MPRHTLPPLAALAAMALLAPPAPAVIKNIVALGAEIEGREFILVAKVDKLDPARPSMILKVDEPLKGKPAFAALPVLLQGNDEATKARHADELLKRLAVDTPVVLFVRDNKDTTLNAFAFTEGTWFQLTGTADGESVRWKLVSAEPYLRRTFKGTTAEMRQVIKDVLAKKGKAPEPDEKVEPGFGPELPKKAGRLPGLPSTPVGVIPTFVIIGPLAVLAALFPAVFGGLAVFMKRWTALLSAVCTLSTMWLVLMFVRPAWPDSFWVSPAGVWLTFAGLTAACAVWAAWRHSSAVARGQGDAWRPGRADLATLVVLGVVFAGLTGAAVWLRRPLLDSPQLDLLLCGLAVAAGVGAVLWSRGAVPLSAEAVILWASAAGCTSAAALEFGRNVPENPVLVWKFQPAGGGTVFSTPAMAGDKLYVTAAHHNGTTGAVYCVDAETGRRLWHFNGTFTFDAAGTALNKLGPDEWPENLKGVFCSPAVADGKVYFGEGFHQDKGCRVFCLDAETGKPAWKTPYRAASHTESTPVVADGRVYFGAGDDGVVCVDAKTGERQWNYPGLHVDANLAAADGRLYGGSGTGVGNLYNDCTVFCLDLNPETVDRSNPDAPKPKELWRLPTEVSVYGSPLVEGDRVYFGTGNGDMLASNPRPKGAVLCVTKDGVRQWVADLPDAVLGRPTAVNGDVVVGCRDGFCYRLKAADGSPVWKSDVGGPVVTALAAPADAKGKARSVYAAVSTGLFAGLDAETGRQQWSFDVPRQAHKGSALLCSSPVAREADGRRRFWFGAGLGEAFENPTTARVYCLEEPASK